LKLKNGQQGSAITQNYTPPTNKKNKKERKKFVSVWTREFQSLVLWIDSTAERTARKSFFYF
jgi:hypothetical protein